MKWLSLRLKLIIFFLLIIFSLVAIDILIQFNTNYIIKIVNDTIDSINTVNETKQNINELNFYIQRFLTTNDSDSMLSIYGTMNSINDKFNKMETTLISSEEYLYYSNAKTLFNYVSGYAEKLVLYKKGNLPLAKLYSDYLNAVDFLDTYLLKLGEQKVKFSMDVYKKTQKEVSAIKKINILIILIWTLISVVLSITFSQSITLPIIKLSKVSNKIAQGNLDTDLPLYTSNDEVSTLYSSFRNMILKIKDMLKSLEEKADLERMITQQRIEAIKYKQALQEAELKNLQAQINPHFLFNTLNTILQIAMFENAHKTYDILLRTSNYLRYVVHNINRIVKLEEEIENINNYMFIYYARFGENIKTEYEIEDECKMALVPCMILQPLVENSILHGFKNKEEGVIRIRAYKDDDHLMIEVKDNGSGMNKNILEKLQNYSLDNSEHSIGLSNIIGRLSFLFKIERPLAVFSNPDSGTQIVIRIPFVTDIATFEIKGAEIND